MVNAQLLNAVYHAFADKNSLPDFSEAQGSARVYGFHPYPAQNVRRSFSVRLLASNDLRLGDRSDDELMFEIPTQRFDPKHPECDIWCSYPVADRAAAIAEWLETDDANQYGKILFTQLAISR